ncbi:MAG: 2-oxoacid:acceptor oxidoreductase subunit alpha [Rhodothermaceae bacterium]|nr:2-oxoacid:acceptor oxidoreductase subunit alpha [Rhodothermaceae bacterium]
MSVQTPEKAVETLSEATVLFAGDSGDGMQLTGTQFTLATAFAQNDLATLPDFPAEIRAPVGTTYGVSGFQLKFGSTDIKTPGDEVDLLVAMNPAALSVNINRVKKGGTVIVNTDSFEKKDLKLAKLTTNPLEDGTLDGFQTIRLELTKLTRETLKDSGLNTKEIDRSKNMFALGLSLWLFSRPMQPAIDWISNKFAKKPVIKDSNLLLLKKGFHYGETTEQFVYRYEVNPASLKKGLYRAIRGTEAMALGFVAATQKSGLKILYGAYPITPASDMLHEMSRHKNFGIMTFQAEDEIAAACAALGASFSGTLGVTASSGPGIALKGEALGLAMMTELPMVVVNIQRGGPSTGLPTKTEQSDLLMAVYGRNGEAPMPVISASTPGDCFEAAFEACRIAVKYRTPVMLMSDGYLANGSAPWLIPDLDLLPEFSADFLTEPNGEVDGEPALFAYLRDEETLARPWVRPGTKGLEHRLGGLEKADKTGNVSYDPENHQFMVKTRAAKVERVVQDIPATDVYGDESGEVLVIGWGSTRGSIEAAVDQCRESGMQVGAIHLRYIVPFPGDIPEIFSRYKRLIVPELNNGQLIKLLRDKYLLPFEALNKIQGQPFKASEIVEAIKGE